MYDWGPAVVSSAVLTAAGISHARDPRSLGRAVRDHGILGQRVQVAVVFSLPVMEVVLGITGLVALSTSHASVSAQMVLAVQASLLATFTGYLGVAIARGVKGDCGCGLPGATRVDLVAVARAALLCACAASQLQVLYRPGPPAWVLPMTIAVFVGFWLVSRGQTAKKQRVTRRDVITYLHTNHGPCLVAVVSLHCQSCNILLDLLRTEVASPLVVLSEETNPAASLADVTSAFNLRSLPAVAKFNSNAGSLEWAPMMSIHRWLSESGFLHPNERLEQHVSYIR